MGRYSSRSKTTLSGGTAHGFATRQKDIGGRSGLPWGSGWSWPAVRPPLRRDRQRRRVPISPSTSTRSPARAFCARWPLSLEERDGRAPATVEGEAVTASGCHDGELDAWERHAGMSL